MACTRESHENRKSRGLRYFLRNVQYVGIQSDEVESLVLGNCKLCASTISYSITAHTPVEVRALVEALL